MSRSVLEVVRQLLGQVLLHDTEELRGLALHLERRSSRDVSRGCMWGCMGMSEVDGSATLFDIWIWVEGPELWDLGG